MNRIQPIFILSLPRTGSTLLQRLLSSHAAISTTPEPWLLLPFLHPLASDGAGAEYSYSTLRLAQQEMFKLLPNGQADYFEAVQKAALHIYGQLSHPDSIYFWIRPQDIT
ncbi:MAG: sulfotransferase [Anaerolineales bacterium]|nr:sulfotransferase [Anaerolineales bacterium]